MEAGVVDHQVGGQGRQPGRHGRDVQVVDLAHVVVGEQPGAHVGERQAPRRGLEQDVGGLPEQVEGARDDQGDDDQRGHRVGAVPPRRGDQDRGHDDGDRPEGVGHDLEVGRAHVEVVVLAPARGQDRHADDVAEQAHDAEDQHRAAGHLRRLVETAHSLDQHEAADGQQQGRLCGCAEHLGAAQAPGVGVARRSSDDRGDDQGHGQPGDVGEHVGGVGQQREAARHDGAHDLDDQHRHGEGEDDGQSPPGVRRRVRVALTHGASLGGQEGR